MRFAALFLFACAAELAAQPFVIQPFPPRCDAGPDACQGDACTVDFRVSSSAIGELRRFRDAVNKPGTTVRLGPDIVLDFTHWPAVELPININRCVTLTSVASFDGPVVVGAAVGPFRPASPQARSPRSLGPTLKYGPSKEGAKTFLEIRCLPDPNILPRDHVRISGFRIYGPHMGQQSTSEVGLRIIRCLDIKIDNMEIAGFAEQGIMIQDIGPGEPDDGSLGRIDDPSQVVVSNSYIHHNQHPQIDGHAGGYGVATNASASATILHNVFDFNRHSIEADGRSDGYVARRNLVLKGGGFHGKFYNTYTHAFDAHGTGDDGLGGDAGKDFVYDGNAFQFRKDNAIKIRGKPGHLALFINNVFPHPGLEDDWGDDAINLDTTTHTQIGSGNRIEIDTFGQYGVCDFDGDGVDDLFLATGASWWYSSFGEFHWTHLSDNNEMGKQVRLGYFDDDAKCDVLAADAGGQWVISSGGTGPWTPLPGFRVPLDQVVFGRFDPRIRDHRLNVTKKTTHAFRRLRDGRWAISPLSAPDWQVIGGSRVPLDKLRFGSFTGDGNTDVLAVVSGRWQISRAARTTWEPLNSLGDDMSELFIANLDPDDNIDDILKLKRTHVLVANTPPTMRSTLTWYRSKNGRGPWTELRKYTFTYPADWEHVRPVYGYAGRFGAAPGGGVMIIDPNRRGQFFSPAETRVGANANWSSVFPY